MSIEADVETINQAATDVETCRSDVETNANTVRNMASMMESAWKGAAATSFQNLMVRFDERIREIDTGLTTISETLVRNGASVDETDTDGAGQFGALEV